MDSGLNKIKMEKVDSTYRMDDTKLLWHMDRIKALERGERVAPIMIDMGISWALK